MNSHVSYRSVLAMLLLGVVIWFLPVPEGLTAPAWHLFAIFITTIIAVILNVASIFNLAIAALAIAILTGTLTPEQAYSGFSAGFILLIVVAFLLARAAINSGLGERIAYLIIRRLGKSTLGLGYSMAITDAIIAPAFPSNTARSGVLFPIIQAIALGGGSRPDDGTERKLGNFLMMNGIAGLTISSALWLTAMAANPAGVGIAEEFGININFSSWLLASVVPSLTALIVVPYVLFKVANPTVKRTPEAPELASAKLQEMGQLTSKEWIMGITFILVVIAWALSETLGIDKTAIAFLGLAVVMFANIFTAEDLKAQGTVLDIWVWFAILYTLSNALNEFGFMPWLGDRIAALLTGFSWPVVYVVLVVSYVLIHYFFVSQTAQMLALYGVFLSVGLTAGVPGPLLALMLLFATNFFAAITPQGSSANVIFAASGYLETQEMYKYGAVITAVNTLIYLTVGSAWISLVAP
ncbi:MAG: DASS family sodium-coupled anion symporter [Ardenticatenales bacterium]|nr:DASS family sodium-coupled anion symporter [Ardenticatenales bacterium]